MYGISYSKMIGQMLDGLKNAVANTKEHNWLEQRNAIKGYYLGYMFWTNKAEKRAWQLAWDRLTNEQQDKIFTEVMNIVAR